MDLRDVDEGLLAKMIEGCAATMVAKVLGRDATMKAWVSQREKTWVVYWNDPEGKRRQEACGTGERGRLLAEKKRRKIDAELLLGTYEANVKKTWMEFRQQYCDLVLPGLGLRTQETVRKVFEHFEATVKLGKAADITTKKLAEYVAARRSAPGKFEGTTLSPSTINRELRHLKSALKQAKEWGYLKEVPTFKMQVTIKRQPRYMPTDTFEAIYMACDKATLPDGQPYPPADWWRGLLVFCWATGWRREEMLALRREHVDFERSRVFIPGEQTKGREDAWVLLPSKAVEHLRRLPGFTEAMFPWAANRRYLYDEFYRIQAAAGISKPYGFHAIRKSCGTFNASKLSPKQLQARMRHASLSTTMDFYVNAIAEEEEAVKLLHMPAV